MKLEALIATRDYPEDSPKATGDVVVVKPAGARWSDWEDTDFVIVDWLDDQPSALGAAGSIEAELMRQIDAGEPHPVVTLPYMEDDDPEEIPQ